MLFECLFVFLTSPAQKPPLFWLLRNTRKLRNDPISHGPDLISTLHLCSQSNKPKIPLPFFNTQQTKTHFLSSTHLCKKHCSMVRWPSADWYQSCFGKICFLNATPLTIRLLSNPLIDHLCRDSYEATAAKTSSPWCQNEVTPEIQQLVCAQTQTCIVGEWSADTDRYLGVWPDLTQSGKLDSRLYSCLREQRKSYTCKQDMDCKSSGSL